MKQKILILQGLPASGKSTYARELMEREPNKWKRINKDLLREMCDCGKWSKENETVIIKLRNSLIEDYLFIGFNVIVDDTNFSQEHIKTINEIAEDNKTEVEIKFIDTPVYECIERDALRGDKSVGKKVILDMYRRYLQKPPKPLIRDTELPDAIIVDVDGTLAYKGDRDIFDYSKVCLDAPNDNLIDIINSLVGYNVIVLSGRDDDSMNKTKQWLKDNGLIYHYIYMRKTGDKRDDTIVKKELYETHIKGQYNVIGVFDDRPKVVRMWKQEGLFVLDCNREDSRIDF